jgi:hypothetical protein
MYDSMAVGADYRKVVESRLGSVLNLGQRQQVVYLAVVTGCATVCTTEGESANLAVKRGCMPLLVPHDGPFALALKVQYQPPLSLGRGEFVDVHVNAGRSV